MATMIRWNPIREMMAIQNAFDRAYADGWRTVRASANAYSLPLDVYENEAAYTFVASLPGVGAENIQVNWHDDAVTIQAEVPQSAPSDDGVRAHRVERPAGKFSRTIQLSKPINTEAVEAVYVDGVLTLTLPKSPEAQPKVIPVRSTLSPN